MENNVVFVFIFIVFVFIAIIFNLISSAKEKEFLRTHVIKCKQCGSTDTSYIKMETSSTHYGKNSISATTRRGKDKFYCNKCKKNHFIENGDWILLN